MKIAINGEIIDTENIYKIGVIETGYWYCGEDYNYFVHTPEIEECENCRFFITMFDKQIIIIETIILKLENLNNMRNSIIKTWSENQSTIPQFNLE